MTWLGWHRNLPGTAGGEREGEEARREGGRRQTGGERETEGESQRDEGMNCTQNVGYTTGTREGVFPPCMVLTGGPWCGRLLSPRGY